MRQYPKQLYEFGDFRLDLANRMLLRAGHYVPLTPKTFETLVALVARSGRIADREELLQEIWPDTFVEDVSLAKNVSTLRKILGGIGGSTYIETVPRRGYRFAADVRVIEAPEDSAMQPMPEPHAATENLSPAAPVDIEPPKSAHLPRFRFPVAAGFRTVVLFGLLASGLGGWAIFMRRSPANPSALNTTPLTSYPGRQSQIAFSPDGNRIAFAWGGMDNGNSHIYLKQIGTEAVAPVTQGDDSDSKPAWSPDGRLIAFLRSSSHRRGWYVMPTGGGPERKIADLYPYFDLGNGNSPYFSPDGKHLVIPDKASGSEPTSLYLVSVDHSERRRLTTPPAGSTGDYYPAFSPNGKFVAFARAANFASTDVYVMPVAGGEPNRLTFDSLLIQGLTWTADGKEIVFASRRGGSVNSIWRISAKGGRPRPIEVIGKDVISPAISPRGNRLAYVHVLDDYNIWRVEIDAAGEAGAPKRWIASTFRDGDPAISPDSSKIAFASGRSGSMGIWLCDADGSNAHQIFDGGANLTGSPRWSPDGKFLVFDSRANLHGASGRPSIYVIAADGGAARELVEGSGVAPSWSRDGKWIYFVSTRTGSSQVWKLPASGGLAAQVTRHGGFEAYESPDGKTLYYLKGRELPGIWKIPAQGGDETQVTAQDEAGVWRYWQVGENGIYFATVKPDTGPVVEFLNFANGKLAEISRGLKPPERNAPGLAVSPDGRFLLYMQDDQNGSDVMMLEGFR